MKFKIILDRSLSQTEFNWVNVHALNKSVLNVSDSGNRIVASEYDIVNIAMYLKRNNIDYSYEALQNIW